MMAAVVSHRDFGIGSGTVIWEGKRGKYYLN
jgi:hypothetical protein